MIVVYFFGLKLGWFPIQHAYDNGVVPGANWPFIWSAIRHGTLPALVIVLAFAGGWALNMRTVMINTISEDYVAMAHAKGLRDNRDCLKHFRTRVSEAALLELAAREFRGKQCDADALLRGARRRGHGVDAHDLRRLQRFHADGRGPAIPVLASRFVHEQRVLVQVFVAIHGPLEQ